MPITSQELGRRLRAAREACRMTQDEVAQALGVARTTLTQMELGNRNVTSLELDRLANLYGRDLRDFLSEAFREEDALAALFRAQAEVVREPAVLDGLRSCLALGRETTNLEHLLGIDRSGLVLPSYGREAAGNRWEAIQTGQRLAEEERRRLGLGSAPLPDLMDLLEAQGVRTALVTLPDDISGLTLNDAGIGLLVVANRDQHPNRWRFSFAHEYAHVLLDRHLLGVVSRSSERDDLLEVRANAFAACFLMPEEGVRLFISALGKGQPSRVQAQVFDEKAVLAVEGRAEPGTQDLQIYDIVRLAHAFQVSVAAMLYRLRNLRLLTEAELENLKKQDETLGRQVARLLGLPQPDGNHARIEFRSRFLGLALEAYRREEITRSKLGELAALIELSDGDLDQLLEETGLGEQAGDVLVPGRSN